MYSIFSGSHKLHHLREMLHCVQSFTRASGGAATGGWWGDVIASKQWWWGRGSNRWSGCWHCYWAWWCTGDSFLVYTLSGDHNCTLMIITRYYVAKQYAFRQWQFDSRISVVEPPSKCFWRGTSNGFVAVSSIQLAILLHWLVCLTSSAWKFLLEFYSI